MIVGITLVVLSIVVAVLIFLAVIKVIVKKRRLNRSREPPIYAIPHHIYEEVPEIADERNIQLSENVAYAEANNIQISNNAAYGQFNL